MNIEQYAITIAYAFIAIACMVILKYALNAKSAGNYSADKQLAEGNLAVGLRRTGAQFGLTIAMTGALSGAVSESITQDFISTFLWGLMSIAFIISSLVISDKIILPGVNNQEELKNNNESVGFVEFGMLTATGIIAYSSIQGDGGSAISSIAYFIVGQISLIALVLFYEKVVTGKHNIVKAIAEGKKSSGIYLAGKFIAYSLILKSAIAGNAIDAPLMTLATEFVVLAVSGMLILYIFEWILDRLIITSTTVNKLLAENEIAQSVQISVLKIGLALMLSNGIL